MTTGFISAFGKLTPGVPSSLPLRVFDDQQALLDNVNTSLNAMYSAVNDVLGGGRRTYRDTSFISLVKSGAGFGDETVGLQSGVSVGTSGTLDNTYSAIAVTSEAQAQGWAASGAGTEADPYIIEDREINGAGTNATGLRLDDSDADYYILIRNCRIYDHTSQCVEQNFGTKVIYENLEVYNTSGTAKLFQIDGGDCELRLCLFSGCDQFASFIADSAYSGTVTVRNLKVDTSRGNYNAGKEIFYCNAPNAKWDFKYIDVDMSGNSGDVRTAFYLEDAADDSVFENIKIRGPNLENAFSDTIGTPTVKNGLIIRYFDIQDVEQEAITIGAVDGGLITRGLIAHNTVGAGYRLVYMEGSETDATLCPVDTTFSWLKLTKQTGTKVATNECLETNRAKGCTFEYCYVTECPEDAFEMILSHPNAHNTVRYCVGENVGGQVVDIWRQWDFVAGATETDAVRDPVYSYVHHIGGDCADIAVTQDAFRGGVVHDIYVVNTAGTSNLVQGRTRDTAAAATAPIDIYVSGPLTLSADVAADEIAFTGSSPAPSDCEGNYFDNTSGNGTMTTVTS